MPDEMINKLSIEQLMQLPIGENVQKAMEICEEVQNTLYNLCTSPDKDLLKMRAGTILTLAVLKKALSGIKPDQFTKDDWADIAGAVSEYAINVDDQYYSVFIFALYSDYIKQSTLLLWNKISEGTLDEIRLQAELLEAETAKLHEETITETEYIDSCLWICLEAVLKLLCLH